MRALLQRAKRGAVTIDDQTVAQIGRGLVVLLGVGSLDIEADAKYLAEKTAHLRVFPDAAGKLNLSVLDIGGEVLVVSQFTLYGDCQKGRRPSFSQAAPLDLANRLYQLYAAELAGLGLKVATGVFQAEMAVEIINDGPVTLWLKSKNEE